MWYATMNEYGYLEDYGPFTCVRKAKKFARSWCDNVEPDPDGLGINVFAIFKSTKGN